jgi:NodT family efflux transporter outer membrane factor (OMF) lipoprotein
MRYRADPGAFSSGQAFWAGVEVSLHSRLRASASAVALLLTSCAVGPDFKVPPPPEVGTFLPGRAADRVPGRTVVRGAEIPAQWWELFRSPALDRVVQQGIVFNADLAAAEAAVRVAQANARAQRGALFPTVAGTFDASRQKVSTDLTSPLESGANIFNLYTAQLTVTYMADVWGGTRRQIEAADAQTENQAFQREAVYLTLASNIALAAIEEARLRGQIAATQRIVRLQSDLLGILRRQFDQGQIGRPNVVTQETALAQSQLLLPPLERDLAKQRNLLAILTGRFPNEPNLETFQLGSFRLPRRLPLSMPADLVRQRPDIRAAEANLRAANAQIGVAIANRLPQITLTGNTGSTSEKLSQLFSPGTGFWMIGSNVAQTVFDAGTLENKQHAAEEATNQAVAQYRGVVLAAFQNVADVLRALQADARAITAAAAAERSAEENVNLVRRQVEEGQVNIVLLIQSQQAFLQALLAHVDARASRLADTVALFQALGGGWWNRPISPDLRRD